MLKRLIILCSILIVLPAGAGWAQSADQTSQTTPDQQSSTSSAHVTNMTINGTVISKTANSVTIRTASGSQQFTVDSATIEPSALHVGDMVKVAYRQDADSDALIATQISVTAAADTSTAAASNTTTSSPSQSSTAAKTGSSASSTSTAPEQQPEAAEPPSAPAVAATSGSAQAQSSSPRAGSMSEGSQPSAAQSGQSVTRVPSAQELPKTASSMPLIALIGILALVVALTAFLVRHQQRA